MDKPVNELSYTEAVNELQQILSQMQSDRCEIDKLSAMTLRATDLLKECRSRLTATDQELRTILQQLEVNQ